MIVDWHNGESVDQLLLHCSLANGNGLVVFVFTLFRVSWVMLKKNQFLDCWQGKFHRHSHLKIWKVAPLCVLWTIWQRGIVGPFDGVEWPNHVVKQMIVDLYMSG